MDYELGVLINQVLHKMDAQLELLDGIATQLIKLRQEVAQEENQNGNEHTEESRREKATRS